MQNNDPRPRDPANWKNPEEWTADEIDRMLEEGVRDLEGLAAKGDALAAKRLHGALAHRLRDNNLLEYDREILCRMHDLIANGVDARVATLTAKPPNAPLQRVRDSDLFLHIYCYVVAYEARKISPPMGKLYEQAGEAFGISATRAKSIYLTEKRAFDEMVRKAPPLNDP